MTWLLMFLVHSTLWCVLAWASLRLFKSAHARVRELIWYTAIGASFITPSVQSLMAPEAATWHLSLPVAASSFEGEHAEGRGSRHAELVATESIGEEGHHTEPGAASSTTWTGWGGFSWLLIAGVLLIGNWARLAKLRRRLAAREVVTSSKPLAELLRLSRMAGLDHAPRLTVSDELRSPIAMGLGSSSEICVPSRALLELDEDEFSALLGHEVAHHPRRDTLRMGCLSSLQAVFFIQPLFRLADSDLHFAAEEQCDAWAASQIKDRFAMASCLTEVAAWVLRQDRNIPVPCMARRPSQLEARVQRLMEDGKTGEPPARALRVIAAASALVLAAWLAPAIAASNDGAQGGDAQGGDAHEGEQGHPAYEHREPSRATGEHGEPRERRSEHEDRARSSEHERRGHRE